MYDETTRRRRKSSFAALYKSIIIEDEINSSTSESNTREESIKNHVSVMNTEIDFWKKKLHETKYKHVSKSRIIDPILTWNDCKDCLTAEDIAIMKEKTSCEELAKEVLRVDQKTKIVSCLLDKMDVKVNACMKKKCASVFKMKKDVCNFLLDCDESNEPLEFEDDMTI